MKTIFIVGVPRSGTTVLQSLFNRSDRIALLPETHFFTNKIHLKADIDDALQAFSQTEECRSLGISIDKLLASIKYQNKDKAPDLFTKLMDLYTEDEEVDIVGEKTPGNYEYLDEIRQLIRGARFIWLIRDPRAIAASYKNVPWNNGKSVVGPAMRWKRSVEILYDGNIGSSDVIWLRYEDLVLEPTVILERLAGFIGVGYINKLNDLPPRMISSAASGEWQEKHLRRAGGALDQQSLTSWRHKLSRTEIAVIDFLCSRYYKRFGYQQQSGVNPFYVAFEIVKFCFFNPEIILSKLRGFLRK